MFGLACAAVSSRPVCLLVFLSSLFSCLLCLQGCQVLFRLLSSCLFCLCLLIFQFGPCFLVLSRPRISKPGRFRPSGWCCLSKHGHVFGRADPCHFCSQRIFPEVNTEHGHHGQFVSGFRCPLLGNKTCLNGTTEKCRLIEHRPLVVPFLGGRSIWALLLLLASINLNIFVRPIGT